MKKDNIAEFVEKHPFMSHCGIKPTKDIYGHKHYILEFVCVKEDEIKNGHIDLHSDFITGIQVLGELCEVMEKFNIPNVKFLNSLLTLFNSKIHTVRYSDEQRQSHLRINDSDFGFTMGGKNVYACGDEISSTDYQRLKMFLPKDHVHDND